MCPARSICSALIGHKVKIGTLDATWKMPRVKAIQLTKQMLQYLSTCGAEEKKKNILVRTLRPPDFSVSFMKVGINHNLWSLMLLI